MDGPYKPMSLHANEGQHVVFRTLAGVSKLPYSYVSHVTSREVHMAPTSTTARPMPLRRSAGALALGIGLLLTGLQSAHAETPASPPPVGGFSELPRSAQGQALQEEGLSLIHI